MLSFELLFLLFCRVGISGVWLRAAEGHASQTVKHSKLRGFEGFVAESGPSQTRRILRGYCEPVWVPTTGCA